MFHCFKKYRDLSYLNFLKSHFLLLTLSIDRKRLENLTEKIKKYYSEKIRKVGWEKNLILMIKVEISCKSYLSTPFFQKNFFFELRSNFSNRSEGSAEDPVSSRGIQNILFGFLALPPSPMTT